MPEATEPAVASANLASLAETGAADFSCPTPEAETAPPGKPAARSTSNAGVSGSGSISSIKESLPPAPPEKGAGVIPTRSPAGETTATERKVQANPPPNRIREDAPPVEANVAIEAKRTPPHTTDTHHTNLPGEHNQEATAAPVAATPHPHTNPVVAAEPASSAASGHEPAAVVIPHPAPAGQIAEPAARPATAAPDSAPFAGEQAPCTAPSGPVHLSKMAGNSQQCEMHIGLRTTAFGTVEVHTFVRDNTVGVSIGSDRAEIRQWISAEVPRLAVSLQQHELQLDHLQFFHIDTQAGFGASPQFSEQSSQGWTHDRPVARATPEIPESNDPTAVPVPDMYAEQDGRLNLHA
jgi:hypothetical protein